MHDTSLISGNAFAKTYGKENYIVVDLGGLNVNGSLKNFFIENNMKYICVDLEKHPSVDVVISPGDKLPFENESVDLIVSTSCFEHDPCFWITFREMTRIIKKEGYIYISAPSNGVYHAHPVDNWRFYSDSGQALAFWSGYQMNNEDIFPVEVVESFHVLPKSDIWVDFVCVWKRTENSTKSILLPDKIKSNIGPLQNAIRSMGLRTEFKFSFLQNNVRTNNLSDSKLLTVD